MYNHCKTEVSPVFSCRCGSWGEVGLGMRLVQISILCFAIPLSVKEKINIKLANQKQEAMSFLESDLPINSFPSLSGLQLHQKHEKCILCMGSWIFNYLQWYSELQLRWKIIFPFLAKSHAHAHTLPYKVCIWARDFARNGKIIFQCNCNSL